jgi:hypothetical protein
MVRLRAQPFPNIGGGVNDWQGEVGQSVRFARTGRGLQPRWEHDPLDDGGTAPVIIFGTRTTVRLLAILNFVCARCGNPSAHRIEERVRKFTLFFIPLFPIGARRTYGTCTYCGLVTDIDPPTRERLLAQAQQPAPGGGLPEQPSQYR